MADCDFSLHCSPGVERFKKTVFLNQTVLENALDFKFKQPTFLVTYHPATLSLETVEKDIHALFSALDAFPEAQVLITKANADEAGRFINRCIDQYANRRSSHVKAFMNLGETYYPSVMRLSDVVIGNSSSGIIEAPSLHIPTVNIGSRQDGRLRANSIIDCHTDAYSIQKAIQKALSNAFKDIVKNTVSPYDCVDTAKTIKNTIKTINLKTLPKKVFYDLEVHGYEQSAHVCHR
jgi:UDP-hydrolysing UDP-N-acetyl-D-glucosamine 2-epimerase